MNVPDLQDGPDGLGVEEDAGPHPGELDEAVDRDGDDRRANEYPDQPVRGKPTHGPHQRFEEPVVKLKKAQTVE